MKKTTSILTVLLILSISCTKEMSSNQLKSKNLSDASTATAKITCECAPGNLYYRVYYTLNNVKSGNGFWLVFSADAEHTGTIQRLQTVDGDNVIYIRHQDPDGNVVPSGQGALYIVKGKEPVRGAEILNILAEEINGLNTDTSACPEYHIHSGSYNPVPVP